MLGQVKLCPDYPLITSRLRLRPLSTADTEDLLAYRSLQDVCRFVPFEPMDAAAVAEKLKAGWSRRGIAAEGDAVTLGIELAESGRLVGDVMLLFGSAEHRGGEIGWVLHPGYSGQGYATEAQGAWSDEVDLALLDSEWAVQHAAGQRSCPRPLVAPMSPH